MSNFLIDSHCHLDIFSDFELAEIIAKAKQNNVVAIINAGTSPEQFERTLDRFGSKDKFNLVIFQKSSFQIQWQSILNSPNTLGVFLTLGLHPMEVTERWLNSSGEFNNTIHASDLTNFKNILENNLDYVWALGEIGWDLSKDVLSKKNCINLDKYSLFNLQQLAVQACSSFASKYNLPVIIHTRSAWKNSFTEINKLLLMGVPKIMLHCYSGSAEELGKNLTSNLFFSFGGPITWKNAEKARNSLSACPFQNLLIETDSPDLSPEYPDGTRPSRNEPFELLKICEKTALIKNLTSQTIAQTTSKSSLNFLNLNI